jgi:hypothetical protein
MIRGYALATVVCLIGFSCAKQPPTAATLKPTPSNMPAASAVNKSAAPKPVTNASKYPVIVHVVSRDRTVTVSSGPHGLVYSMAQNADGKVLIADATGPEFEQLEPALYRSIRGYIAVKSNDAFMWDGVDEQSRAEREVNHAVEASAVRE